MLMLIVMLVREEGKEGGREREKQLKEIKMLLPSCSHLGCYLGQV